MVHGMAEQSGGKLILKSTLGQGTTADICLPVAFSEPEAGSKEIKEAIPYHFGRKLRIVSVDDDPLVSFNTSAMLGFGAYGLCGRKRRAGARNTAP